MPSKKPVIPHHTVRRRLRAAREALGYSIPDVARIIGYYAKAVEDMESGKGGFTYKSRLALKRYANWLKEEAESQAPARMREWLAMFEPRKICPEESDLWTA